MKRFIFVPISGYVDNETTLVFTSVELAGRGFSPKDILTIMATEKGMSRYIWDGSCACTMVRVLDAPGVDPVFKIVGIKVEEPVYAGIEELLRHNSDDEGFCEWLIHAAVGEEWHGSQGSITVTRTDSWQ